MNLHGDEFVYRLSSHVSGSHPGAHLGRNRGSGMNFAAHARLFDIPDPRRLDLRASINDARGDWLVRTYQQPASITLHVVLDMSASMRFGRPGKLKVAAQFLHSLGVSAHAYGDAISLLPFDTEFREDLYRPATRGRAVGAHMAHSILNAKSFETKNKQLNRTDSALHSALQRIEGCTGIVFLVSDFHWSLSALSPLLGKLANATLVPMIVWDQAEVIPPEPGQVMFARDMKNAKRQQLWISQSKRQQWLDNIRARREQLEALFSEQSCTPFFIESTFNGERLSRYFTEKIS